MIISKITSGLGNQLFQYALGRTLSIKHKTELKLDITNFDIYTNRTFGLNAFSINTPIASTKEIEAYLNKDSIFKRLFFPYQKRTYVRERSYQFDPVVLTAGSNTYLEGYWQSEQYFKAIETTIRQDLIFRSPLSAQSLPYAELIHNADAISVHIRRGDYVSHPTIRQTHGVLPLAYYHCAIGEISNRFPEAHLFIFSDDIAWCQTHLSSTLPMTFIDTRSDIDDLQLMSRCKHHIIGNSSFSWWGAWLNPSSQKIVIAPWPWLVSSTYSPKDIIPSGWITLDSGL